MIDLISELTIAFRTVVPESFYLKNKKKKLSIPI